MCVMISAEYSTDVSILLLRARSSLREKDVNTEWENVEEPDRNRTEPKASVRTRDFNKNLFPDAVHAETRR